MSTGAKASPQIANQRDKNNHQSRFIRVVTEKVQCRSGEGRQWLLWTGQDWLSFEEITFHTDSDFLEESRVCKGPRCGHATTRSYSETC